MTQLDISRLGGEGILTPEDIPELKAGARRVLALMRDSRFHSAEEIMVAAGKGGVPAMEGLRRMRELRAHGFDVEKEMVGTRRWMYRLKERPPKHARHDGQLGLPLDSSPEGAS